MNRVRTVAAAALAVCLCTSAQARESAMKSDSVPDNAIHVILFRKGPAWAEGKPMSEQGLRPHGLYYKTLLDEGKVMAAGRLSEMNGGLVLTRFRSREEAQAAVAADPAVKSGIFIGEVQTWVIRFSDGTVVEPRR